MSPEHKAKISAANEGKTKTPEHKAKISAAKTGTISALNIETDEVTRIPTDLFYSRKDIYFTTRSKVYKNWKSKITTEGDQ